MENLSAMLVPLLLDMTAATWSRSSTASSDLLLVQRKLLLGRSVTRRDRLWLSTNLLACSSIPMRTATFCSTKTITGAKKVFLNIGKKKLLSSFSFKEFSEGCYFAYMKPSAIIRFKDALTAPVQNRIFYCGTETAREWIGYIEGALESGERVAAEVIKAEKETNSKL